MLIARIGGRLVRQDGLGEIGPRFTHVTGPVAANPPVRVWPVAPPAPIVRTVPSGRCAAGEQETYAGKTVSYGTNGQSIRCELTYCYTPGVGTRDILANCVPCSGPLGPC